MTGTRFKSQSGFTESGFTLLEVMVVLGIIAALTAMIVPRISNQNNQMRSAVRHLGVLAKETHNHSKLYGNTYRIVISLGDGNDKESPQQYWVEQSTQPYLLPEDKQSILEQAKEDAENDDDDEDKEKKAFEPAVRLMKEPKELPGDLRFTHVEIEGLERPIESGTAYIHFFPQGRVEEAIIQLGIGEDLNWSISLHPLTGKADIITRKITLSELNKE